MDHTISSVDSYITAAPETARPLLQQVRATILNAAPDAIESISYGMPTYKIGGKPLVYFAVFKKHIGFYATPTGHEAFAAELAAYKQGKGSVQFPLDRPIPFDLIGRITSFRLAERKPAPGGAKKAKAGSVEAFLAALSHPLKPVVMALHEAILAADAEVAAQVKWNAPAYFFTGSMKAFDPKTYKRDIVVMNLHRKDRVLLVFPTGSTIDDDSGLLGGSFRDTRETAEFTSLAAMLQRKADLQALIQNWLSQVERA